jgi:hypothetical protein
MLLENEVLLEAMELISSKEDQIDQVEIYTPGGCSACGYGAY